MSVLDRLALTLPIVQAPMAGVSTPALAAAVSNAGGLGSLGLGATDAAGARAMIGALRALTNRAFNVNLFVHASAQSDRTREAAWLQALAPLFRSFGAECSATIRTTSSATISATSTGGTLLGWVAACQARSRRRRWPERPGFTGGYPAQTMGERCYLR